MAFLGSPSCCVVVIPSCSLSSRLLQKKIHTLPLPLHHYTKRNRPDYFSNANASPSPSPRKFVKCLSQKKQSQAESAEAATQFQFERLFSNLNQATLKREPGSLSSAVFLVAGTTVGAGILAIPAVTQESGFLASAITCIFCWAYMVVTGLLIAEVNVNTMAELGSGGVSLVSMAMRTVGNVGVQIVCWTYIFIHYALLVAYVARSSEILTNFVGIPLWESATLFSLVLGSICYFGSQRFIGAVNGVLVFGIIASFAALVLIGSQSTTKRRQMIQEYTSQHQIKILQLSNS